MLVAAIRESLIEAGEAAGGPVPNGAQLRSSELQRSAQNGLGTVLAGGAAAGSGSGAPDSTPQLQQVCQLASSRCCMSQADGHSVHPSVCGGMSWHLIATLRLGSEYGWHGSCACSQAGVVHRRRVPSMTARARLPACTCSPWTQTIIATGVVSAATTSS